MGWGLAPGQSWVDVVQLLLVILAGLAAFWKWGLGEWRARQRELPSICTEGGAHIVDVGKTRCLYNLHIKVANPGILPVYLDHEETVLVVYKLPADLPDAGAIAPIDDWIIARTPLIPRAEQAVVLEPGTQTELNIPLTLPAKSICVVECYFTLFKSRVEQGPGKPPRLTYHRHTNVLKTP